MEWNEMKRLCAERDREKDCSLWVRTITDFTLKIELVYPLVEFIILKLSIPYLLFTNIVIEIFRVV